jgi:hypothetical protein
MIPNDIKTYLAWEFDRVLPGFFKRNKVQYSHIEFTILGPLPTNKMSTPPMEGASINGPFIYFVLNKNDEICYIGKSKEKNVIKRWVRPGNGGPSTHYWTHTNKKAGCVRRISEGIKMGSGPYKLRFMSLYSTPEHYVKVFAEKHPNKVPLDQVEDGFIEMLKPLWNGN